MQRHRRHNVVDYTALAERNRVRRMIDVVHSSGVSAPPTPAVTGSTVCTLRCCEARAAPDWRLPPSLSISYWTMLRTPATWQIFNGYLKQQDKISGSVSFYLLPHLHTGRRLLLRTSAAHSCSGFILFLSADQSIRGNILAGFNWDSLIRCGRVY